MTADTSCPDSTPPPTSPSLISPTSTAVSNGDFVINIQSDPEKGNAIEQDSNADEKDILRQADAKDESARGRISNCWQKISSLSSRPHIPSPHRNSDGRMRLVQRIEDHPRGYSQFAAFMNTDENFLMCRSYGFLHNRVLLYRQDELSQLEKQLIAMDDEDRETCPQRLQSRKTDESMDDSRKTLIQKIDEKLGEYDNLVSRIRTYVSLKKPSGRDLSSFMHWVWDEKPLSREESRFLEHQDDFVALSDGQEVGWLDGFVEDSMTKCIPKRLMKKLFTSKEQYRKSDDENLHLMSKYRMDVLVRLILTLTTVGLLVGPSAILFFVPDHRTLKIVLIMLFTLLFSAAVSVFTKAKRHEMLAATATYAAVLVVFLGNFPL
ncbi:hypothetical protein JMJ35_003913 [Cladonia borealis]|uniref:DUF6594 domain-containing protein n=1 Tax=Cladonia borealis TaxID=184061 RepID=A0AA39R494_9LECA|nr:hypothetical protein JMJ35_003913 [Cladonia borealis]